MQCHVRPNTFSFRASLVLAGLALAASGIAALTQYELVLYNPTASLERGFYIRADQPVERGVVVTIPVGAVDLAYVEDGHVEVSGDRFLKRIAAMEGDRVCSGNGRITISARRFTSLLRRSRPLVEWSFTRCAAGKFI
jgi:type IV secretory pathway protease TraF